MTVLKQKERDILKLCYQLLENTKVKSKRLKQGKYFEM